MNHTDLSARKGHVRMGLFLAVIYQFIVAAHIVLLCFFPQINSSFMISVEFLYALAWIGYCFHKKIHELASGTLFGGAFLALYLVWKYAYRFVRRFVEVSLSGKILISFLITAEAAFLSMLVVLIFAKLRLRKRLN